MAPWRNIAYEYIESLIMQLDVSAILNAIRAMSAEVVAALTEVLKKSGETINQGTIKALFLTAMTFCSDNPVNAAAMVLAFIAFAAPAALWSPFASLLGFTSLGPAAGSAAAFFQAKFGAVAGFSIIQSASMAGYGVAIMNGVTQAGAVAVGATPWLYNAVTSWWSSKL